MKKEDLIVGKEYITNDGTNVKAFYRGNDIYKDAIFEVSNGQEETAGVPHLLGVEGPIDIASGRYWCYGGIEEYFDEIDQLR